MARIAEEELARLKQEVSVERLAEASGVKLVKHGADWLGLCPFHDDKEPSLVVSPAKNLWHCLGACQAGGSVVDWVMRAERVSFRRAVEMLREMAGVGPEAGKETSTSKTLPSPVTRDATDEELLAQVVSYYHETLKASPEALQYLEDRGLQSVEVIERFRLGFANRTLAYRLPSKRVKAGEEVRGRLQSLGLLRASGHEHFNGSLVVPVFDAAGRVVEIYGRKVTPNLRQGTPLHLYLPGPHRGVFNLEALQASHEVILCEALLDALTFYAHGFRHVTSAYGIEGFTGEHLEAFEAYGTKRVLIAYDRDDAGDAAADKLAAKLQAKGIECYRVQFPRGMDANEYALKVTPAAKSLDLVLRKAVWMGEGEAPARHPVGAPAPPPKGEHGGPPLRAETPPSAVGAAPCGGPGVSAPPPPDTPPHPPLAASGSELPLPPAGEGRGEGSAASLPPASPLSGEGRGEGSPASLLPASPPAEVVAEGNEREVTIPLGDRRYRVRGMARNLSFDVLKVNLLASRKEAFHVDTLDLYSARQRQAYGKQAALELGLEEEAVKKDLGRVLLKLEELQDEQIRAALEPKKPAAVELSSAEREAALALLRSPDLPAKILEDFGRCGVVGEHTNLLMGYLAAVSRKLEKPLAVVVQSSSAAGKSALMEAVLALMPAEERISYSAMTGQSLFYMGSSDLKHKILAIAEEEGAERASYALKLLQSEGELTIASTGKDPHSGKLVTHEYRVEGPVALLLTTTAIDVDEELLNRCLVLTVEESREQTRAIHKLQRERRTLAGLLATSEREELVKLHQNAQRLLRPLAVVNPFAPELTFLDTQIRTRRDHEKYLTLIDSLALLHQHQREVKRAERGGRTVEYIEVTLADIETANRLAHEVLGRSLDELPPQTRRLLGLLDRMVAEQCERLKMERRDFRFSRREVREATGWGNTQLHLHLLRLVALEYVLVHRGARGQSFVYELAYEEPKDGRAWSLPGLIDVEALQKRGYDAKFSGQATNLSGSIRGRSGPDSGGIRSEDSSRKQASNPDFESFSPKTAHRGVEGKVSSYRSRAVVGEVPVAFPLAAASSASGSGGR